MIPVNLEKRIELLSYLGAYMLENGEAWQSAVERSFQANAWFTPEFTGFATRQIALGWLNRADLERTAAAYGIPSLQQHPRQVGLVMAGNIPLVGFHDFLCILLSGHQMMIKPSSKDDILIRHLAERLIAWEPALESAIQFGTLLKGCDAYIATGSNNSARYFEQYFGKYPHLIRRNRTSVAILDGQETETELEKLADDIYLYFGLGCRNVTKIYVPEDYPFEVLLQAGRAYRILEEHHKYKNNYDYQLALMILNKQYYMSNPVLLLREDPSVFSPISVLHYETYKAGEDPLAALRGSEDIQCVVGRGGTPFGQAQRPGLLDFADGTDTLKFLLGL